MTKQTRQQYDQAAALFYDRSVSAPLVSAVGERELASTIRSLALRYGVPIESDSELARLLGDLEEENEIPPSLYEKVAQVFARKGRAHRR